MTKLKTAVDVPALVDDLIAASDQVAAIGRHGYCVIDSTNPAADRKVEEILKAFGARDHLYYEIIDCLIERGRHVDPEKVAEEYARACALDTSGAPAAWDFRANCQGWLGG